VNERELASQLPLQGMLGYLNFSNGRPDARFQKQVDDSYGVLLKHGAGEPWRALRPLLSGALKELAAGGSGAFQDITQAEGVLRAVYDHVLPAYRAHHADLLFHLSDEELSNSFFVARVFEAVLAQGAPWDEHTRLTAGALKQLNDYVGHRPIAVLETRPKGEPYDHERVRPIPLYLRGVGPAAGRYHDLIEQALQVLERVRDSSQSSILTEAHFDLEKLDELAVDPRSYDHSHPANRRPNYVFGEWDPHLIDNQGHYRRFVVRQVILDALLQGAAGRQDVPPAEALFEAGAVLSGTMLMAAATSGSGPTVHDSSVTLATLTPQIARLRDSYYAALLQLDGGERGERLRREATKARQPFGTARAHLNHYLAEHRALQLQHSHLALLYAEMGQADASRQELAKIPTASVRMLCEIFIAIKTCRHGCMAGKLREAAGAPGRIYELIQRGIHCGALADPWNILGFQGLFPLFQAREDSVRDSRIDDLIGVVEQTFDAFARVMSEAGAAGEQELLDRLNREVRTLAGWWDQFASVEVHDVDHVSGGESAAAAEQVARALGKWRERGEASADLRFWRQHLEDFHSPKAFALVAETLLRKHDYRAALALLMNWLAQADEVPLEEADYSFHALAFQWMLGVMTGPVDASTGNGVSARWGLVQKFFDFLEANADELWQVPTLELTARTAAAPPDDKEEDLYGAAYEDVTYRDSTDDSNEGAIIDGGPERDFDFEAEAERLHAHMLFLANLARLWNLAGRQEAPPSDQEARRLTLGQWLATARKNEKALLSLLDALHDYEIPEPIGSFDAVVEFEHACNVKEVLLNTVIDTCLETALAVGILQGRQQAATPDAARLEQSQEDRPVWYRSATAMELAGQRGDQKSVLANFPLFLATFKNEPLLFRPVNEGGEPKKILRTRLAQAILRRLAQRLPLLGLVAETHQLLRRALELERLHPAEGRSVTEFNLLFEAGFQAVVTEVVESLADQEDELTLDLLQELTGPFLQLWIDHAKHLRLSSIAEIGSDAAREGAYAFIKTYGRDLFHAKFLTLANLRGILHQGVDKYLASLEENPDPLHPLRLIDDLGKQIERTTAVRHLTVILRILSEYYEEYKDYNTTTTNSDYGDNLHMLIDFLRLKASYDQRAWEFRPIMMVHEVLARGQRQAGARLWEESFAEMVDELAQDYLDEYEELREKHGIRLRTVEARLQERFAKPMDLDRLRALIEPATNIREPAEQAKAFADLREGVDRYMASATPAGLEVPAWLRQLEIELDEVIEAAADQFNGQTELEEPRRLLSVDEIRRILKIWGETPGLMPPETTEN
jgi:hypothetical protein